MDQLFFSGNLLLKEKQKNVDSITLQLVQLRTSCVWIYKPDWYRSQYPKNSLPWYSRLFLLSNISSVIKTALERNGFCTVEQFLSCFLTTSPSSSSSNSAELSWPKFWFFLFLLVLLLFADAYVKYFKVAIRHVASLLRMILFSFLPKFCNACNVSIVYLIQGYAFSLTTFLCVLSYLFWAFLGCCAFLDVSICSLPLVYFVLDETKKLFDYICVLVSSELFTLI